MRQVGQEQEARPLQQVRQVRQERQERQVRQVRQVRQGRQERQVRQVSISFRGRCSMCFSGLEELFFLLEK